MAQQTLTVDPAVKNGHLTSKKVGEGKAARERRLAPPSHTAGPKKSEVSYITLSNDLKYVKGRPLPYVCSQRHRHLYIHTHPPTVMDTFTVIIKINKPIAIFWAGMCQKKNILLI